MTERPAPSVSIRDGTIAEIDEQLEYGDSRADWIRDAIRAKLRREGVNVPPNAQGGDEEGDDA
jgi:metal-responsive CopG/Arc/MetJ family transcriptional regulator